MNGHQLDRYRRRCHQKHRQVWGWYRHLLPSELHFDPDDGDGMSKEFWYAARFDWRLNPWCVSSHQECRRCIVGQSRQGLIIGHDILDSAAVDHVEDEMLNIRDAT